MRFRNLKLSQTEAMLKVWRDAPLPARPVGGWVGAIREALGLSATALAKRLGMSHTAISKFEKAEAQDTITLGSLRKLASALDCELQYALIPRLPLEEQLKEQALRVAKARLAPAAHSMSLEAQSVQGTAQEKQIELLAQELLQGSRRELW